MPRKPSNKDSDSRQANNLLEPESSTKQPFTKVGGSRGATEHGTHPLMRSMSRIEEIAAGWDKRKQDEEVIIERIEEWKIAVNGLAATPNGQLFFQMLIKDSGLFKPPTSGNHARSAEEKIKASFYLRHVRPYLEKDLRKEIE